MLGAERPSTACVGTPQVILILIPCPHTETTDNAVLPLPDPRAGLKQRCNSQ